MRSLLYSLPFVLFGDVSPPGLYLAIRKFHTGDQGQHKDKKFTPATMNGSCSSLVENECSD